MDRLTKEQRHINMQHCRNKDSDIEILLRKELWRRGVRYRKNVKDIVGHPDLAFKGHKLAVFVDGEYWHGYDWEHKKKEIKSNRDFWIPKIERNIKRDFEVTTTLENAGWTVLRFWGKTVKADPAHCADIIEGALHGNI